MNQTNAWINDCDDVMRGCPIYKKLYDDILIEYKAPLKRTFEYFAKLAHYRQRADECIINEEITAEYNQLIEKSDSSYSYDLIDDITSIDAESIQTLLFNQEADMDDKHKFKKYFLKSQFLDNAEDETIDTDNGIIEVLPHIFDKNLFKTVQQIVKLINTKDNLFNKIKDFNSLDTIFPVNIKKIKLNDDLKDIIFRNFTFKYLKRSSSDNLIIKDVYNLFFNTFIIETEYDEKTKHTKYNIQTDKWDGIYEFVTEYYKFPNTRVNLIYDEATNSLIEDKNIYPSNKSQK
jgi:hypothetical protein